MLSYIVGSGFYDQPGFSSSQVGTRYGLVTVWHGNVSQGRPVMLVSRHGEGHYRLSNQINHRANLLALKQSGATAVVSCSVCGVLRDDWQIGRPLLASELYFPSNRLPGGELCTVFDQPGEPGRGHLIAGSLLDRGLTDAVEQAWRQSGLEPLSGVYGHVDGPRLNTKAEIGALRSAGVDFISQTCGPEAVLANELELPYALAAFGVDHANGVVDPPTPPAVLAANLGEGTKAFRTLIAQLAEPEQGFAFANFVYRFGS